MHRYTLILLAVFGCSEANPGRTNSGTGGTNGSTNGGTNGGTNGSASATGGEAQVTFFTAGLQPPLMKASELMATAAAPAEPVTIAELPSVATEATTEPAAAEPPRADDIIDADPAEAADTILTVATPPWDPDAAAAATLPRRRRGSGQAPREGTRAGQLDGRPVGRKPPPRLLRSSGMAAYRARRSGSSAGPGRPPHLIRPAHTKELTT